MTEKTKMFVILLLLSISIHIFQISGQAPGISSKLDLGDGDLTNIEHEASLSTGLIKALVHLQQSDSSSSSIVSSKLEPKPFSLDAVAQIERKSQAKQGFSGLGLICVDGKCNSTSTNLQRQGKPTTDILVKVSTGSNENDNSNIPVSNGDVPVIVGNAGTNKLSGNRNEINQRREGSISLNTNKNTRYNNNVYPRVSYLNPYYNTHYFGEEPAPQYVWHRRTYQPAHNPNAFQVNRNNFKPSVSWRARYPSLQHVPTCTCNQPGLHWYPMSTSLHTTKNPIINDKLDDL